MGKGPHFDLCKCLAVRRIRHAPKNIADSKGLRPLAGSGAEPQIK